MKIHFTETIQSEQILKDQGFRCYFCDRPFELRTQIQRGRACSFLLCAENGRPKKNAVRFCEYMGKWACKNCHVKDKALTPGHVLRSWDFTPYGYVFFLCGVLTMIICMMMQ